MPLYIGKPKIVPLPIETVALQQLSHIIFCNLVYATRPVTFHWTRNGRPILLSNDDVRIQNEENFSLLKFNKLQRNDSALYTCNVRDVHGTESTFTKLIVKCKYTIEEAFKMLIR